MVGLSHPVRHGVNDRIPKDLCSLTLFTIDKAMEQIRALGLGTMLAKIDIMSAFCLLLVHPADHHLLVMKWKEQLYIDTCLPFGLRSATKLFNIFADLLSCILEYMGIIKSGHVQIIKGVCQHLASTWPALGCPASCGKGTVKGPS